MANWALVTYKCVCADTEQANELVKVLDELKSLPKPYSESDFGNLWMGCVVARLGGKIDGKDGVRCRGEIFGDYSVEGNVVTLVTEQAWTEQESFRYFVESKFAGMKIYYLCDESNEGIYCTNDKDGRFFHDSYWLDFDTRDPEYFDTIEEAAEYISTLTGRDVEPTVESIESAIEDYQEEQDYSDESMVSFHGGIDYVDD